MAKAVGEKVKKGKKKTKGETDKEQAAASEGKTKSEKNKVVGSSNPIFK